jgi:hypothetical protein
MVAILVCRDKRRENVNILQQVSRLYEVTAQKRTKVSLLMLRGLRRFYFFLLCQLPFSSPQFFVSPFIKTGFKIFLSFLFDIKEK